MLKKLVNDIKALDVEMNTILQEIYLMDNVLNKNVTKNLWLKFNKLYTTRLELVKIIHNNYNVLNNSKCYQGLDYLTNEVITMYCLIKKYSSEKPLIGFKNLKELRANFKGNNK